MADPRHWMHETSGVLKPVVEAYLNNKALSEQDIAILRQYLRQWIMSPVWDSNPYAGDPERLHLARLRSSIDELISRETIEDWIEDADALGIESL